MMGQPVPEETAMTSITISDPALLTQLAAIDGVVELRDPAGTLLARCERPYGALPPGVKSPFTDEQMAEFRKQRTGRPLADIMKDLREKYGE